tara:strand:+ start:2112 stop:2912 length:801 start_codon:yes stop_codon:yes gene_type:complete
MKKKIINIIDNLFDKNSFCKYRNFINFLKKRNVKISFKKNYYILEDTNSNNSIYIYSSSKKRIKRFEMGIIRKTDILAGKYFLNKIKFSEGDIFIDCGANLGELGYYLNFKNKKIKYYAFEPSPIDFYCLNKNLEFYDFAILEKIALSDREGQDKFYLSTDSADSSLLEPNSYSEIININKVRLDNYFTSDTNIKFLKVEAEGHEPEVLYGLERIINKIEYIAVDVSPERYNKSTLVDVCNFLLNNNFNLVEFSPYYLTVLFKNSN